MVILKLKSIWKKLICIRISTKTKPNSETMQKLFVVKNMKRATVQSIRIAKKCGSAE